VAGAPGKISRRAAAQSCPTTAKQDYYELLGVARKASARYPCGHFRKLARKYHPDLNPATKFRGRKVQAQYRKSYDVLSDSKKRQMYDQYGFYSDNLPAGGLEERAATRGAGRQLRFRRI